LGRIGRRVSFAKRLVSFVESVQDEGVQRKFLDGDGEEIALVLGGGEGREGGEEGGELGEHVD